jgi:hypothetical protein
MLTDKRYQGLAVHAHPHPHQQMHTLLLLPSLLLLPPSLPPPLCRHRCRHRCAANAAATAAATAAGYCCRQQQGLWLCQL